MVINLLSMLIYVSILYPSTLGYKVKKCEVILFLRAIHLNKLNILQSGKKFNLVQNIHP